MFPPTIALFANILITGLPTAARDTLTPRELSLCVILLHRGHTLVQALAAIHASRLSLPFDAEVA